MAVSTKISTAVGVKLSEISKSTDDYTYGKIPLGTVVRAQNGRKYVRVQASGTVANDTAVVLTEPGMTVAAGAGSYTTRAGAVVSGDRFWVESNAI